MGPNSRRLYPPPVPAAVRVRDHGWRRACAHYARDKVIFPRSFVVEFRAFFSGVEYTCAIFNYDFRRRRHPFPGEWLALRLGRFVAIRFVFARMQTLVSPVSPYGFQFTAAVRSRSWDWLLELRRRLNVELQLVDERGTPALPQGPGHVAAAVTRLLTGGEPNLRAAISHAAELRGPADVIVDRLQCVCFGLTIGNVAAGVLVLTRDLTTVRQTSDQTRAELELVGSWLSNAIEAHLTSAPVAEGDELQQVSSLCRLLTDAARTGSAHAVISAFAEALAVWHDIDVFGYAATTSGDFILDVSMPGADADDTLQVLDAGALPQLSGLTRLSRSDAERFGLTTDRDVVVATIAHDNGSPSWLVMLMGRIDASDDPRLSLYARLLDQWVDHVLAQSASRITATLALQLLPAEPEAITSATKALDELVSALALSSAAVVVTLPTGGELLRIDPDRLFTDARDNGQRSDRLLVARRTPEQWTTTLAIVRSDRRVFTRSDQRAAAAAADVFGAWAVGQWSRGGRSAERRAAAPVFERLLDGFAAQAIQAGVPVTAAVISADAAVSHPGAIHDWVSALRSHLRAPDLVGRLSEREIGVLLHDTAPPQAATVIARLQLLVAGDDRQPLPTTIGFASRAPGSPGAESLISVARADATRRSASSEYGGAR